MSVVKKLADEVLSNASPARPGRPKKYATEEERVEAQRGWWAKAQGKRRKRYKQDDDFTESAKRHSWQHYRKTRGVATSTLDDRIGNEADHGKVRNLWIGGKHIEGVCFSVEDMANLLEVESFLHLYRWFAADKFPRPQHRQAQMNERNGKMVSPKVKVQKFYTLEEAKKLLAVFAKHRIEYQYLRSDHRATIKELYACVKTR